MTDLFLYYEGFSFVWYSTIYDGESRKDYTPVLYSKIVHITYLVLGLHRRAEDIRMNFSGINSLISNVKKKFKSSIPYNFFFLIGSRCSCCIFNFARWSTWLYSISYFCKYFKPIKNVLQYWSLIHWQFKYKHLVENSEIETNLIYIKSNFEFLVIKIVHLETSEMLSSELVFCIEKI